MRLRRSVPRLFAFFAAGFALVLGQVAWWQSVRAEELAAHPRNPRYWEAAFSVERGSIVSADGVELAVSEPTEPGESALQRRTIKPTYARQYPGGDTFCHVTGYSFWKIGETATELALNQQLIGADMAPPMPRDVWEILLGPPRTGANVELTIDARIQREAEEGLAGRTGAVVAIEVATGAILALADRPGYDPNRVDEPDYWKALNTDEDRPLLARAYQGRYPPGSVFKVVTAALALESGAASPDTEYVCTGVKQYPHSRVVCHQRSGHGRLTLREGIAKSCNIALAEAALAMGPNVFEAGLERLGLDERYPIFRPGEAPGVVAQGSFPTGEALTLQQLAACGYGQGELLMTPLHVAAFGQALGNGGRLLEPYLVRNIQGREGFRPGAGSAPRQVFTPAAAREVVDMMKLVMRPGGTASHLGLGGTTVAGKTGSAENPHGQAHSWFLALAPAESPQVAVAVIVENGGYGGRAAGPIAMSVLREALAR